MLIRAPTIRPGIPRPLQGADFSFDGNFQAGAVLMGPDSFMTGKSTLPDIYQFGVISFWANYDSSASASGDSAKILHLFGDDTLNSHTLSACSFNAPRSKSAFMPTQVGCVGIFLAPQSMDIYLRDLGGQPLLKASIPYVKGDTTVTNAWTDLGPLSTLLTTDGKVLDPCGTDTLSQFVVVNGNQLQQVCNFPDVASITPNPPIVAGDTCTVGPTTFQAVPFAQFQGDFWWNPGSQKGGTPTSGWHHYIFSWDTSQIVTDVNGLNCIRMQAAIDRGGGSIFGGPIFDTKATAIGQTMQPMLNQLEYKGITGTLVNEPRNGKIDSDAWVVKSPFDASCKWAYMYFGVPKNQFFDLNAARPQGGINLDYFITPGLVPQNFGFRGANITPCQAQWMHTGAADQLTSLNVPYFQINNAASPFGPNGWSFNTDSVWQEIGIPLISSSDAPPLPSI